MLLSARPVLAVFFGVSLFALSGGFAFIIHDSASFVS